jgi:hypothetical protein
MQLKDVMTPGVEVLAPEASIYEAAEKMGILMSAHSRSVMASAWSVC